ncbi:MAG: hypothetical protein WKF90_06000 [Pyrinomonadaceae bacterium]
MKQTFSENALRNIYLKLDKQNGSAQISGTNRAPVHVVYGGAHLFKSNTPQKFGKIALGSLAKFAPNFAQFAQAMWLKGADTLPHSDNVIADLEFQLIENVEKVKRENFPAWTAWTIYQKMSEKLRTEPIEDFRIDFEDGYGIRSDKEEDSHAANASGELAEAFLHNTITPFSGFRIKSFAPETYRRAIKTLDLFLTNFVEKSGGRIPENFVVTLPKIMRADEVAALAELLGEFETQHNLPKHSIKIEIMIETPQAIVSEKGEIVLRSLVEAASGRCASAHFGAYDYTANFAVTATHQNLRHEACNFARQMMQIALSPLNIRVSDSVTVEIPTPIHRGENLSSEQKEENFLAVHTAWRKHFANVTGSLINGFYQSWDLHPAQLVPRYAAVYAFFLENSEEQGKRLRGFLDKATQAFLTGNQFDDAASAQGLLNFFTRAISCGAMAEKEVFEAAGLSKSELDSASFAEIMKNRKKASASNETDAFV